MLAWKCAKLTVLVAIEAGLAWLLCLMLSGGPIRCSKESFTKAHVKQLAQACEMFKLDQNRYPEALIDLLHRPTYVAPPRWKQPYVTEKPLDAWGNEFAYGEFGSGFVIRSLGADAVEGTPDDIVIVRRTALCCEDGPTPGHTSR